MFSRKAFDRVLFEISPMAELILMRTEKFPSFGKNNYLLVSSCSIQANTFQDCIWQEDLVAERECPFQNTRVRTDGTGDDSSHSQSFGKPKNIYSRKTSKDYFAVAFASFKINAGLKQASMELSYPPENSQIPLDFQGADTAANVAAAVMRCFIADTASTIITRLRRRPIRHHSTVVTGLRRRSIRCH